jgi:predicted ATP-grasp superfamily ATP-dependent carboligase
MLRAVVEDFERVLGVKTLTLLANDFPESIGRDCRRVGDADESRAFRYLAVQADVALIIAPEFDNLLAGRTGWAVAAGCRLLGCNYDAIRLTGDKLRLARWHRARGIPTPATVSASTTGPTPDWFPCVLKPRHGAGSQATYLVPAPSDWPNALRQALAECPAGDLMVQPLHRGQPASVAFLIGPHQLLATPGATQTLSDDGRFQYLGGRAPLPLPWRERALTLGQRAVESVPGLLGYVGVDLILGDAADGSEDVVIEINPRVTTSYIGLRQLTETNLAELWLRLWEGSRVSEPAWREQALDFTADGQTVQQLV